MHSVTKHEPRPYDPDVVERLLGDAPLPSERDESTPAPFITINGRIHRPTSDFLRAYASGRENPRTASRYADDLRSWLDYLCNERGLHPHEDHRDPIFAATEPDFAAYWRLRQHGPLDRRMSSNGWVNVRKALKRFYEHAQRAYFHQPPFDIQAFQTRTGQRGTHIVGYQPRHKRAGSKGQPLTPAWAEQLLMGALRLDLNGVQDPYLGAERDHALINFALATGIRRKNLAYVTTYEVPPPSALNLTVTRVADLITKRGAGGDAMTFAHRLPPVWDYITGPRAEAAATRPHRPERPLQLLDANLLGFRYRDPQGVDTEKVSTCKWTEADHEMRLRLVNQDGTTPILFLSTLTGGPYAYSSHQHVVTGAADFVRKRINPDFPIGFRVHDLRHTYAVHLTVAIYRGVLADTLNAGSTPDDRWVVDHIGQAVNLAKSSLGHTSEQSTQLYIQTAHRFLGIPLEHFLGGA